MFVTIFDLLAGFIIYMKMANRCAAAGLPSWPLGFWKLHFSQFGNASSSPFACDFLLQLLTLLAWNHAILYSLNVSN